MKFLKFCIALIILVAGYGWLTNKFPPISLSFSPTQIPVDVEAYLHNEEAQFRDIKPGLEKQIIWNDTETKSKTPYSVVYIHGFSASKEEIRPVPDNLAEHLEANLFYTRLTGHGRTNAAMGEMSYNQWVDDLAEAYEIGRRIGDKVIVMGTSLGGALIAWSALEGDTIGTDVVAAILVSPVLRINNFGSSLLTYPYAKFMSRIALGPTRCSGTHASMEILYAWTVCYPSSALLPLAQFVQLVRKAEPDTATIPTLFIYSPNDTEADEAVTAQYYENWGAKKDRLIIQHSQNEKNHIVVGDLESPNNNDLVTKTTISWLEKLGIAPVTPPAMTEEAQ
ncbi:alpha/beta hydrolase [Flexibacterium corallicola]|uniref:alpha/beta hydrolase n=1 Tax=Flexibacterium corallicola TaxID=3037259 RepID=UPI00286EE9A0|nr:alpha/beta fold hydrolase [Pseudovibrio sp. M1P-2-3]